jgi:hypothetical protein
MMLDIIVFVMVNLGLFLAFVAAIEYYWYIGPLAGLFGAVFTLELFNLGPDLILRTFINANGELVYETMQLGMFFYAPIILSALCFAAAIIHKKK